MDPKGNDYKLATAYISSLKNLKSKALEAHNPRQEGFIHYYVKKRLSLSVIKQMAYIIDTWYEDSLLEDLEKVNTEGEDVFVEIDKQENKGNKGNKENKENLIKFFNELAVYMNK